MAISLKEKGHSITVVYFSENLWEQLGFEDKQPYRECIRLKIEDFQGLWDIIEGFDIIHSHNEPDGFAYMALIKPGRKTPVVHDFHDLLSTRGHLSKQALWLEAFVNKNAQGRVYVSQYQMELAHDLYRIDKERSLILPNYTQRGMIPQATKRKLSDLDDEIHLVFGGALSMGNPPHSYLMDIFREIASKGIHLHIYPTLHEEEYRRLVKESPYIHLNPPLSPYEFVYEITQYDYGITLFNHTDANTRHLHGTLPNKLFDYLAAGLPVISSDLYSLRRFIEEEKIGIVIKRIDDIISSRELLSEIEIERERYLMENHIDGLIDLYEKCLE